LPKVTFSTIYHLLVDRKVHLKKVSYLEEIAERSPDSSNEEVFQMCANQAVPIEYTRTLSKAYVFFRDGHVQDIKYHPFPHKPGYVCVRATVLPSMRKNRVYTTVIVFHESTARVASAHCACPAGLSGCCNHLTATLYCLEEYIYLGLYEDELKGCTDRLQMWNHPRKRNVVPQPTDEVILSKAEYGTDKRSKVHRVNSWDCRPVSNRIVDPNKARNLHKRLAVLEQCKITAADEAVSLAVTQSENKKATQTKAMLAKYGTSCFLQLLDEDVPPAVENRIEVMQSERQERLERAVAKKTKILSELAIAQQSISLDHSYACAPDASKSCIVQDQVALVQQQDLVDKLYYNHVWLSPDSCRQLSANTQSQSDSECWHNERKLRITASIMREVCHRKPTTSCEAFVKKKYPINAPAICYGNEMNQ